MLMNTIKIYAAYKPEFNAYCVSDKKISEILVLGKTPEILLRDEDFSSLGGKAVNAPLIGFLMGRQTDHYAIKYSYARSIVRSGARLRLLSYEKVTQQMEGLDGIILPGGCFSSPDFFYNDDREEYIHNLRYVAYETAIIISLRQNIPMLGICAGAQMIAAVMGGRLYRNVAEYTEIAHKTRILNAHNVTILPGNPLSRIFKRKKIVTNSDHKEALNPNVPFELTLYAIAEDGIPEAWGNEEKKILCIQWHVEDLAIEENKEMQEIFNWLTSRATKK